MENCIAIDLVILVAIVIASITVDVSHYYLSHAHHTENIASVAWIYVKEAHYQGMQ